MPQHLLDEERVAFSLAEDRLAELVAHLLFWGAGLLTYSRYHGVDFLRWQATEEDALVEALMTEAGDDLRQGVGPVQLHVPVGPDDEDTVAACAAGEVLEKEQRGLVGPVDVVQEEDKGVGGGGVANEAGDALE